jgi:hypothetical protein
VLPSRSPLQATDNPFKNIALIERIIDHFDEEIGKFSHEDIPAVFVGTWEDVEHGSDVEISCYLHMSSTTCNFCLMLLYAYASRTAFNLSI